MRAFFSAMQRYAERPASINRREFGRRAALLAAGAALPFYNEFTLAQDIQSIANVPSDVVLINANENPMGPCPAAIEAIQGLVPTGGRYHFEQAQAFIEAMAATERVPTSHVLPGAGSSDLLHRTILAFASRTRPLV